MSSFLAGQPLTAAELNVLFDPDRCQVTQDTGTSLPDDVATVLEFDTELSDTASMHSTVTNPSRITVGRDGRYRCIGQVAFDADATGRRIAQLRVNGTGVGEVVADAPPSGAAFVQVVAEPLMTAGQYVELFAQQDSGGSLDTPSNIGSSYLNVVYCGTT